MSDIKRVFISYAWKDGSEAALWLYERFNRLDGWSAWMDKELHAHSVFSAELQRRINEADMVVVVLTPDVNRLNPPSFVQRELGYATQPKVKKPVYAVEALPTEVPLIIWGVTFVDFQDPASYESAFHGLIGKINHGTVDGMLTRRDRELAYLRDIAREEITRQAAKFYAELPAQAKRRVNAVMKGMIEDDEAAAILAELAADIHTKPHHSPDDDPNAYRVEDFNQLSDALSKYPRVAIIGDPGSGKTTTLRRLTYLLAEAAAQDETAPLPVYVPLGGYKGGDFATYINAHFGTLHVRDYLIPHPERLVVLLDGLNETTRGNVATIQKWLTDHKNISVRLTCRKLDYVERELDLQRVDVQPLDYQRIIQFMAAYKLSENACMALFWRLAGESSEKTHPLLQKFQEKKLTLQDLFIGKPLERDHPIYSDMSATEYQLYHDIRHEGKYPALLGLARNPFLLTITMSIYINYGDLPRNRTGLLRTFTQKLLKDRGHLSTQQQGLLWLDETVLENALSVLAYEMLAQGRGTGVPYEWARDIVAQAIPGHDATHILYLCASAGIIERGSEVRFIHQLLQEYFAAYEMGEDLRRGVPATKYFPSDEWWSPTGWEETAVLLAGMEDDCTKVVEWLTPIQPDLAYKVVTESGVTCATSALNALYKPAKYARRSLYAILEGERLNHKNDKHLGIGVVKMPPFLLGKEPKEQLLPDIVWCDVPAAKFLYDGVLVEVPYDFKIAKYSITFRQFQAFIDSGQYDNPIWWKDFPQEYRPQPIVKALYPYYNYPRDNVSWYQAVAFTNWLNHCYQTAGLLNEQVELRLPTETEWMYSVLGNDKEPYIEDDSLEELDKEIKRPGIYDMSRHGFLPVTYPQKGSPFGMFIPLGILEWCLNKREKPDFVKVDDSDEARVLCPGFDFISRPGNKPDQATFDVAIFGFRRLCGFRVVLSAPIVSLKSDTL